MYSLLISNLTTKMQNATKKHVFNEFYMPISEGKKFLSPNERLVFQLLYAMRLNDKGTINSYKTTAKTDATIEAKIVIPLHAEHFHFLISK